MGQAPRRRLRPRVCRRALPRHRHLAAQPRRQVARAARGPRRARRAPAADPAQRRAPRPRRRPARLRHLLAAARGGRGAGRSLSRRLARFRAAPGRARLGGDDRRRLPRRRGLPAPDPGAPRHRRLLRRHVRAPPRRIDSGNRRRTRANDRPHPDPRFRQPGDPADRAAGARERGLLRDPPLHDRRGQGARLRPAGDHPVGRPGLGDRGRSAAGAGDRLSPRRAGARHLLRHADDVRRIGRPRRVERASGIRPRLYRHPRRLPAVRRAVAQGRARAGVDEPRRQGRRGAGRLPRGGGERRRALRRDRRRRAPLLRRPVPPRGRAHAAGRRNCCATSPTRRGLPRRLDDGRCSAPRRSSASATGRRTAASSAACRAASIPRSPRRCCTRRSATS